MPNRPLSDIVSCLSGYDPEALPVEQARQIVLDFIRPVEEIENVAIGNALDRVLAIDVVSPIDVPAHDNSAMDGYALRSADLQPGATTLRVIGSALAGNAFDGTVTAGECVHIMTGAVMPDGCDTVVPQEFAETVGTDRITLMPNAVQPGDNRRLKGEDLAIGQIALRQGTLLRPAHLGLLASLGMTEIPVRRKLRVAFFSTGDELRPLGEPLDEGCIYDSNRYTIYGMLTRLGCELIDMGIVRDDPALLETAFRSACENADAIITSGGVSVGAADYTKQVMARLGDMHFWKIAMRPGRPMAFGRISSNGNSAVLFGLPGNPVAVMVTFYFLAREALRFMMGTNPAPLPLWQAKSLASIRKKAGRTEYQRGILSRNANGELQVEITGSQGSGILSSMTEANCFIVLPDNR
ncbi:MAG: gephyrin-like molybdotransferase Glp, partial [Burkholderiaceae bacterium]|nr:gephyrin-like molybdotransferase Glp [Burkholderiaceae bacterium]